MKNIHVLPTDKPSRLYLTTKEYVFEEVNLVSTDECQNKHIYITSDEEIKVGDWFAVELFKITGESRGLHIEKCIKLNDIWCNDFDVVSTRHKGNCNKIILTTDQDLIKDGVQAIDDDFLEWFVKNPSCEFVEVFDDWNSPRIDAYGYKIIIPKEEPKQDLPQLGTKEFNDLASSYFGGKPKQETLEEAIDRISKENGYDIEGGKVADFVDGMVKGAKWQQEQDKNKYSEEDLKEAFDNGRTVKNYKGEWQETYSDEMTSCKYENFKDWFEKFKNK